MADTATALLGIVNVHGLLEAPLEHEAPVTDQLENCQPGEGVAVTETVVPTASEQ